MQHPAWWAQYILNIVRKQPSAPYVESEKLKKSIVVTNQFGLNLLSLLEFGETMMLCNVQESRTAAAASTLF